MPRYKLTIEYDGTPFCGWQRQDNGVSVQETLEKAVKAFTSESVVIQGAGRTDAGVHARGMVAHFDLVKSQELRVIRDAMNHHLLPAPIAVISAQEVGGDFHARFSCTRRYYEYRIINRRAPLTLDHNRAWRVTTPLDAGAMHEAAQALVGKHDFTTFRAAACQSASPVKTLAHISVERDSEFVLIRCSALSFLHNQVRSMAGSLAEVGKGKWSIADVKKALEARDRARCGAVAPAHGLYFLKAYYESA